MTNTETKQGMNEMLNELMLEKHITLSDVYHCAEQHMDEINGMMRIFEHESNKDQRLVLELFGLLAQDQSETVIDFYSRAYNLPPIRLDSSKEDLELLLTAGLYNPSFFSFALSLFENIKSKLIQLEPGSDKEKPPIIPFPTKKPDRVIVAVAQEKAALKPAAASTKFVSFFDKLLDCEGIRGRLFFLGNNQHDVRLEFIFDKPQKTIPCKLQVCITTQCDGKKHPPITIPGEGGDVIDGEIDTISSDQIKGINYSGGFDYSVTAILQNVP